MAQHTLLTLGEEVRRIFAAIHALSVRHHGTYSAAYVAARVELLCELLGVLDATIGHPDADAKLLNEAHVLRAAIRTQLTLATGHALPWAQRPQPADHIAATPEYSLYHHSTTDRIADDLHGVFPTLADAMAAAGHPDPTDWTTVSGVHDFLVVDSPHNPDQPAKFPWVIHGHQVLGEYVCLLMGRFVAPQHDAQLATPKDPLVDELARYIASKHLGPATVIVPTGTPVEVAIDPHHRSKAHLLHRWLQHLTMVDYVLHRRPKTSPRIRLNIRGLWGEIPLVVYAVFDRSQEPAHYGVLDTTFHGRASFHIYDLLDTLAVHESSNGGASNGLAR